jgi:Asp-tRNA(Asn)/Glu-tRNA(Gln) amidotransferase A subunit family amidase
MPLCKTSTSLSCQRLLCLHAEYLLPEVKEVLLKDCNVLPALQQILPLSMVSEIDAENGYYFLAKLTASNISASGHPALSMPVGFSPAQDDPSVQLPVGLQIVGRKFDDVLLLKVAASWEKYYDWNSPASTNILEGELH